MLNIFAFLVLIVSLALILVIISKKFPHLKELEVENIEKEKITKRSLLEQRLKRKTQEIVGKFKLKKRLRGFKKIQEGLITGYQKVKKKKDAYLNELRAAQLTAEEAEEEETSDTDQEKTAKKTKPKVESPLIQARELLRTGKLKEAEAVILAIITRNPKSLKAYKLLGEVYSELKNFVHAEATHEHVVKLAERLKKLKAIDYLDLAQTKLRLEKFEDALQAAKKAISLEPQNPKVLHFLIKACIACKQKELAWKYYDQLKKANGNGNHLDELLEDLKRL